MGGKQQDLDTFCKDELMNIASNKAGGSHYRLEALRLLLVKHLAERYSNNAAIAAVTGLNPTP